MAHFINDDNSSRTKKRIFEQTITLLNTSSEQDVTVPKICKAANITKSTFYYYYHSVDDVISYYRTFLSEDVSARMSEVLLQKGYVNQILKLFEITHEVMAGSGLGLISALYISEMKNKALADYPHSQPLYEIVKSLIEKAKDSGEILSSASAEELSIACYYIQRGILVVWIAEGGKFDLCQRCQENLLQLLK